MIGIFCTDLVQTLKWQTAILLRCKAALNRAPEPCSAALVALRPASERARTSRVSCSASRSASIDEVARAVALPDAEARLLALGFEPSTGTADEVAALIKGELPKWAGVIRAAGIKPN